MRGLARWNSTVVALSGLRARSQRLTVYGERCDLRGVRRTWTRAEQDALHRRNRQYAYPRASKYAMSITPSVSNLTATCRRAIHFRRVRLAI